jgi:phosphotransferase system HPr-like phosphotransfer protein
MVLQISLKTVSRIKSFVSLASEQPCDLKLANGNYQIDAKSILAIFSLNLANPIDFIVPLEGEELQEVKHIFKDYIIEKNA